MWGGREARSGQEGRDPEAGWNVTFKGPSVCRQRPGSRLVCGRRIILWVSDGPCACSNCDQGQGWVTPTHGPPTPGTQSSAQKGASCEDQWGSHQGTVRSSWL